MNFKGRWPKIHPHTIEESREIHISQLEERIPPGKDGKDTVWRVTEYSWSTLHCENRGNGQVWRIGCPGTLSH